jgi:hypothetical protein
MNPDYVWATTAIEAFTVFVIGPAISLAIAYAAWRGKPQNFILGQSVVVAVAAALISGLLFGFSLWIGRDFRSPLYLLRTACILLFGLSLGVFMGCIQAMVLLPIFTRIWHWHKATRLPTVSPKGD